MVLSLLLACMQSVNGVVVDEEEKLRLYQGLGPPLTLVPGDDNPEVAYLQDCTVELEGRMLGRRFLVDEWQVLAAADGSAPFVGVVVRDGNRLMLHDHNSGAVYVLAGHDELSAFEGRPLLVIGFITGPQVVQVMGWRVLDDA
jgi:hypothetical protein